MIANSPIGGKVGAGVRDGKGSKGLGRMGIRYHDQGTAFPSKGFSFPLIRSMHLWYHCNMYLCMLDKKDSLFRLKINHASESETCVYSWYTGPHGSAW